MYGLFQTSFYFGYMAVFSTALGIMCGKFWNSWNIMSKSLSVSESEKHSNGESRNDTLLFDQEHQNKFQSQNKNDWHFFKHFIYLFLEGERERNISVGCLLHAPYWGSGPQPSYVPWLGIEPVTLWFIGQHSIHWATPVRAFFCFVLFFLRVPPLATGWVIE